LPRCPSTGELYRALHRAEDARVLDLRRIAARSPALPDDGVGHLGFADDAVRPLGIGIGNFRRADRP
jgi:hypothetical protein